nr:MAG TPA: hypothetical protein [Bacteriophage sp.]DAI28542.1 MAG TPA: hypothetical protein [Caudoviricetes sp.]DAL08430.1 MAG TPA_asm: hypothetical protein [Caudoviricetes sp.]DAL69927.1 MAG TPA: hypothetical protein [Caudoviricetes sp.]DAP76897.1 MAG TPA: hypothetical protein [Caudoviricetes sp.]
MYKYTFFFRKNMNKYTINQIFSIYLHKYFVYICRKVVFQG